MKGVLKESQMEMGLLNHFLEATAAEKEPNWSCRPQRHPFLKQLFIPTLLLPQRFCKIHTVNIYKVQPVISDDQIWIEKSLVLTDQRTTQLNVNAALCFLHERCGKLENR